MKNFKVYSICNETDFICEISIEFYSFKRFIGRYQFTKYKEGGYSKREYFDGEIYTYSPSSMRKHQRYILSALSKLRELDVVTLKEVCKKLSRSKTIIQFNFIINTL